ncbi:hypothetical protein M3231_17705 [Neobacillus mesonae]|nr:hypothetical protein [Neobacillus mesonae]
MYHVNEYVIYGNNGVCQIKSIGALPILDPNKQYYTLSPLFSTETIYTPTDTTIFMRPVISREEAIVLFDEVDTFIANISEHSQGISLVDHYEDYLKSLKSQDLVQLVKVIYTKRYLAIQNGKKTISLRDQQFLKEAEKLLYGEIAIAMGSTKEELKDKFDQKLEEEIALFLEEHEAGN